MKDVWVTEDMGNGLPNYALNLPVLRVTSLANKSKRRAARPAG